ncbi:hypothetical protein CALCODRAFT_485251 [Calocera cornea HHB12733]|uniref:GDP/GTP exchange factor Sec2 N-terminal domain-containing protein n=1 Tax=Calocera cornea HHB12733 TaxID=1353952 RepID=A0A165EFN3_9BASI|nr:hypothetical protein CALCODRAFT_485251 [Calocera cornea HHB12733]
MSLRTTDYYASSPTTTTTPSSLPLPIPRPPSRAPSTLTIDPRPHPSRPSSATSIRPLHAQEDSDVEDARRAWQEGDFGEVKQALWTMLNKVDQLSARIRVLLNEQEELSTSLTVAKSNLTLALSNNEMLEDALSRTPASAQPYGFRRHSARDAVQQREVQSAMEPVGGRRSMDTASSADSSPEEGLTFWQSLRRPASAVPKATIMSRPGTPHPPLTAVGVLRERDRASLTSASTPALGDAGELERVREMLRKERGEAELLKKEKAGLEQEIESLSQALFEEANKMVSDERKKRAQAELDLQELRDEREAMRRTLRMVEDENRKLRRGEALPGLALPEKDTVVYPSTSPSSAGGMAVPDSYGYAREQDKDQTPTQPSRPPSVASDGLDDGVRIDRVWLDAISPPALSTFPRPLNLVNGFAQAPALTSTSATPPQEHTASSTLASTHPNHPILSLSSRPRSPARQPQPQPPTPTSRPASPAARIGSALSSAGGYFGQQVSSASGYLSPALETIKGDFREGLGALRSGDRRDGKADPVGMVGRGFAALP